MDTKLPLPCLLLWALGLLGLLAARCAGLGPGDLGFELSARAFAVGGLGYLGLGALLWIGDGESGRSTAEQEQR